MGSQAKQKAMEKENKIKRHRATNERTQREVILQYQINSNYSSFIYYIINFELKFFSSL